MDAPTFYIVNMALVGLMGATVGIIVRIKHGKTDGGWVAEMPYTVPGAVLGIALGATAAWVGLDVIEPKSTLFAEPHREQPERRLPPLISEAIAEEPQR